MSRKLVSCSWSECAHLDPATVAEMLLSIPPHQRDARSKGIPELGAGAVYPINEDEILIDDFPIPPHFPRAYGLDVGWNRWAGVWGALDRNTNILYAYGEYYQGQGTPETHAIGIKRKGAWIPGVIDPASQGSSQVDGVKVMNLCVAAGLDLTLANNDKEAGIWDVWQRLQAGTLKIFKSLVNTRQEYRLYRRASDNSGKIVKAKLPPELPEGRSAAEYGDHLMDALRYLVRSGIARMKTEPIKKAVGDSGLYRPHGSDQGWMG